VLLGCALPRRRRSPIGAVRAHSRRRRQSPRGTGIRRSCWHGHRTHSACDSPEMVGRLYVSSPRSTTVGTQWWWLWDLQDCREFPRPFEPQDCPSQLRLSRIRRNSKKLEDAGKGLTLRNWETRSGVRRNWKGKWLISGAGRRERRWRCWPQYSATNSPARGVAAREAPLQSALFWRVFSIFAFAVKKVGKDACNDTQDLERWKRAVDHGLRAAGAGTGRRPSPA